MNKNIAFFIRHFDERGTGVAIYDYAHYNETLLNNKSFIIHFSLKAQKKYGFDNVKHSFEKFKSRFELIEIDDISDIKQVIEQWGISFFYTLTHGGKDIYQFNNKEIWGSCKTIKHCVFSTTHKESDNYISIGNYLNDKNNTTLPVIPHIINMPDVDEDFRNELNISKDAIVLGRYGGFEKFDLKITHDAIRDFLNNNSNVYFLFMNTKEFYNHPNIIYLDKNINTLYKSKFINTCNAMIHARSDGETFGLSIGEFSSKNKPIITCNCGDLEHIKILGDKAIIYKDYFELLDIFNNISELVNQNKDWNCYKNFSPKIVMDLFNKNIFTKNHSKVTIVTGLWDINRVELDGRWSRSYEYYLGKFKKLLEMPHNMIIFGEKELEEFVFKVRDKKNTQFIIREKKWFKLEFYEKINKIRINKDWYNQTEWLGESTQAKLDLYNPIVMSKPYILNDARILDKFSSTHLFWLDAGIVNTVDNEYFNDYSILEKLKSVNKISFLAFPYKVNTEIHGFEYNKLKEIAGNEVNEVCRGGFFGGSVNNIPKFTNQYHNLMSYTLNEGYMGTEESLFSILLHLYPDDFQYFPIESDGLIRKFFKDVKNNTYKAYNKIKKNRIIDSFPYFNEVELLELRIKLLHDYIDKFIIIDGNRTHTGSPKNFTCKSTLEKLNIRSEKIQVVELDLSIYDNNPHPWVRERAQRNELSKFVNDNDTLFISDCDEIINPLSISYHVNFLNTCNDTLLFIPLYYLQHRADLQVVDEKGQLREWMASYSCKGSFLKLYTPSELREKIAWGENNGKEEFPVNFIYNGEDKNGWHFTWMGDNERKNIKSNSIAEANDIKNNFDIQGKTYEPNIGSKDYLGRKDHILIDFDTTLLPQLIYDLPKVKNFLLP